MPWRRPPWRLPTCSLPWRNGCGRRRPQGSRSPLPAAVQRRGQRRTPARRRSRSQSVLPLTLPAWRTSGIQASTVAGRNCVRNRSTCDVLSRERVHAGGPRVQSVLRRHLGFRCSCASLRIRFLWARNAHLRTSSARGARSVPFQHAAGNVQAASSPRYAAQGAGTVEEVRTENICTHTHTPSAQFSTPLQSAHAAQRRAGTVRDIRREPAGESYSVRRREREREKDTDSACRRERVSRRSRVLPTRFAPPGAHLSPIFGESSSWGETLFFGRKKKRNLFEEARRDGDWRKGRGARPRRRLLLHAGAI